MNRRASSPSRLAPQGFFSPIGRRIDTLLRRCGLARNEAERPFSGVETLENRVLLADDHPNFGQVFNTATPAPVVNIILNGQGIGAASGVIETAGDNDMFRFTSPTTDFVTLWADTINEETGVSVLDSMIQVYRRNPNNTPVFITSGRDSDTLTSGFNSDGWVGFIAQAGVEYFIRVLGETTTGPAAVGAYVIRVDAMTEPFTVDPGSGAGTFNGNLSMTGSDRVFKFTTPNDPFFDSLVTVGDRANPNDLDSRLDVYNAQGVRVRFDSEAGRLSNPYLAYKGAPGAVWYIRLRSDVFNPAVQTGTGAFILAVDAIAERLTPDPVTRLVAVAGSAGGALTASYEFKAQATGLTIITMIPFGLPPLTDPAVHLYDNTGVEIAFNDDFSGLSAQIEAQLFGGQRYYIVGEGFDVAASGGFAIVIETNHTFNNGTVSPTPGDDHPNLPVYDPQQPPAFGTPEYDAIRRAFERATPIVWNAPHPLFDPAGNPLPDRSFVMDGFGTGRIHEIGDSDVFMFTPQVDMLGTYAGNNDDLGTALYVGGEFLTAGNLTSQIRGGSAHISVWDKNDWFPARRGLNGPVYGMARFDFDGDQLDELYVVGDFTTAGNTADPAEDIIVNNIARFAFDPLEGDFVWSAVGNGLNGVGRVAMIFDGEDPDEGGPLPDPGPVLVVGGDFTNPGTRLAQWNGIQWTPVGAGANGPVYALTTWNPPDPDGGSGPLPDLVTQLVIGGQFTSAGGIAANNIVMWDTGSFRALGGTGAAQGANNAVRALIAYDPADPDGPGPAEDPPPYLIAGGSFTSVTNQGGPVNVNRIARYTVVNNALAWQALPGGGVTGGTSPAVYAMTIFDAPLVGGVDDPPVVVIGGSFTSAGGVNANNIARFSQENGWQAMGPGLNGAVRALVAFADTDEPGVNYAGPQLFAGGDFTMFGTGPNPATHVAKWDLNPLTQTFAWGGGAANGGLETGTDGTVHALLDFDDGNPNTWDRHQRHATRLQIVVQPDLGSFLNTFTRVYDSNFNLLYENETIAPPFPDPSGMLDPSLTPADLGELEGIEVWGGEVYYIEIVGQGTGRYSLQVTADAFVEGDINSTITEPPEAGQWAQAPEIVLNNANGDARNFLTPVNSAHTVRAYQTTPIVHYSELGMIHDVLDTDLFFFRAPATGTTEVRLSTSQLLDNFVEFIGPALTRNSTRNGTAETAPLNSLFDGVLKIYDNDFNLIATSDANAAVGGEYAVTNVGTLAGRVFFRRDPMAVFNVVAGERYFVLIQSAALDDYLASNTSEIDWRSVIGAYELQINSMPNLGFVDDHENTQAQLATMIGVNQTLGSPANGTASIAGEIDQNIFNPVDTDLFSFLSTSNGTIRLTVTASPALRTYVQVFDAAINQIGVAQAPSAGATVSFLINVQQGARFYILMAGGPGTNLTEGTYVVSLSEGVYSDDYGSRPGWSGAKEIPKNTYDYDGIEILSGSIEYAGDTDVFKFATIGYDLARVTITGLGQFDPFVQVFEINEDPVGNPIQMLLGLNDDINPPTNLNSLVVFPTTAPDRTSLLTGVTYNYYYIVVSGFDPEVTRGDYTLTLQVAPTDDYPDAGQFPLATPINVPTSTGQGSAAGVIEIPGDTDLLRFTAPAGGPAIVTVTAPATSQLRQGVRIFDENFTPVTDLITGQTLVLGSDALNSTATFRFNVLRQGIYYVQVQGGPLDPNFVNHTSDIGAYTIGVNAPPLDDHANAGEFAFATNVPLSIVSGDGAATGQINPNVDTDLFRILAIANGPLKVSIDTPGSLFTPVLRLFRGNQTEIGTAVVDGGPGDEDGLVNGSVVRTITGAQIDDVFYFLVSSSQSGFATTGAYTATILGNKPPITGTDDHANENEWDDATLVPLAPLSGDATATGGIQYAGDTDLFTFTSLGAGRAFVQVVTPQGQPLDLAVRIFNQNRQEIAFDQLGIPGANANTSFNVNAANQQYFILVAPMADGTGTYTVRIDTAPEINRLYYPEGFASPSIREFVALSNPNNVTVTYTIRLRYEDPALPEVVVALNEQLGAGKRGGVTLSNGTATPLYGITFNKPYAIVIESNGPMGASLSHYDFGTTIGESFTSRTSTFWAFPRGERFPGAVRDFVLVYNPNATASVVVLTAYHADGSAITFSQTIGAFRRGGWAFNQLTTLPLGSFAFTISSAPATPGASHAGVVAALSHYDLINDAGDAMLGDPDGGSTRGVIPGVISGPANFVQISIFNPGDTAANITITGSYLSGTLPSFVRNLTVGAHGVLTLTGAQLAFVNNQPVGLRIASSVNVAFFARERQLTEGNATLGATAAGTRFFFGDAFISVPQAGIRYFENLYFYNPDSAGLTVDVRIMFSNGDISSVPVFVAGDGFARLQLHQLSEILSRGGNQFFALDISAPRPFVVTMNHYDLFLTGGWSSGGAPLGLLNPLATII